MVSPGRGEPRSRVVACRYSEETGVRRQESEDGEKPFWLLSPDSWILTILGDPSERVPPVPIPNTEVKPLSPDGTARASVWESRKSPN